MDKPHNKWFSPLGDGSSGIEAILDSIPGAVGIWSSDRLFGILNATLRELIGLSDRSFLKDSSFWIDRIHPLDRGLFSDAWRGLLGGEEGAVSCDYRFSPNKGAGYIWLREISASSLNPLGGVEWVSSVYVDISDLKARYPEGREEKRPTNISEIIADLAHQIQNNVHALSWGLDLLRLPPDRSAEFQTVIQSLEGVGKSLGELHECLVSPEAQYSRANAGVILAEVAGHMEKELHLQGVRLKFDSREPLPLIQLDLKQFRSALEQVMGFARTLLPQGGELEIEAGQKEIEGQRYVTIQFISSSAVALNVEENEVFRPFLQVNGRQVGPSLIMANQILRRHHKGDILFQMENPKRGVFTLLLEA